MIGSGLASSSTSVSAETCILDCTYDVFLSFSGEDTRKNFCDHLYKALRKKGIRTFRDEEEVRAGESISPALSNAIKRSRSFIVIFSKNYPNSTWCLSELDQIMECRRTTGRKVYPIFYHVEPSEILEQKGDYEIMPLTLCEENAGEERKQKIRCWKAAIREARELKGKHVKDQYESVVVKEVIEETLLHMMPKPCVKDELAAEESILKDVIKFINIQPEDVRMIGIHGINGIGKTTIAKAICNKISSQFEGVSFLANVKKVSKEYFGLQRLQEQLFCDILLPRGSREIIFHARNNVSKDMIFHRKVLIFLDDVDSLEQVQFLAAEPESFGKGSRIILTTSIHQEILTEHGVELYELRKLEFPEDFRLFTQHAITKQQSLCNYFGLSRRATEYCGGLPLPLKVFGSFLLGKTPKNWECALEDFEGRLGESDKKILDHALGAILKELSQEKKDMFFDVAFFFNGEDISFVTKMLRTPDFSPEDGITVLSDRCLLTVSDQKLWMHDSIQEVGQEMVRQQNWRKKGKRSRLCRHYDVKDVLSCKKGTDAIEGIFLDLSELGQLLQLDSDAFAKMTELRVLKVFLGCKNVCEENCRVFFSGDLELSASDLTYLHWHRYPSDSFPSSFLKAGVLLELHMPYSCLKHLKEDKVCFPWLTVLDLRYSTNLVEISNFSTMPKLEKLILEGCTSLLELHSSAGDLDMLKLLNLNGCTNLVSLPSSLFKLKSLETLTLSGCFRQKDMAVNLARLRISENATASAYGSQIPLFGLCSLKELDLSDCHLSDRVIPTDFWGLSSLERLNLSGNDFSVIPESITRLSKLTVLQLGYCRRLRAIPNLSPAVEEVDARGCSYLEPSFNYAKTILSRIQRIAPEKQFFIILPGSEIPDWFEHRRTGYSVKLSPKWHEGNLLGFAFCVVFAAENGRPEHSPVVSCKINNGFRFSYTFSRGHGEKGFVDFDHVWLAYQPLARVGDFHPDIWTRIKASFEVFGLGRQNRVKKCAINLIYADK